MTIKTAFLIIILTIIILLLVIVRYRIRMRNLKVLNRKLGFSKYELKRKRES